MRVLAFVLATALPATLLAAPDFTSSTLTVRPEAPLEGDLIEFTVTARNTGDRDAPMTQASVMLPREGFYIDVTGLDREIHDRDAGTISGSLIVPAGGEVRFTFRVLAPRDSGARILSPRVTLSSLSDASPPQTMQVDVVIDTRLGTSGVRIGGIRIAPAGLAVLCVLALLRVVSAPAPALRCVGFSTRTTGIAEPC